MTQSPRALDSYAAYIFDVDGTLLYPQTVVPGAAEALSTLKANGKKLLAVTNNSSSRRHNIAERFREYGLPLSDEEVFSALVATAQFVAHEKPGARVLVFGNPGLHAEVAEAGLVSVEAEDVDYVIVGNHHSPTFDLLGIAMRALIAGARFVAVNADRRYMGRAGVLVPGAGAWVAALETTSGHALDVVVGKPSATILLEAAGALGCAPEDCIYVGDNLDVDVGGAHTAGMAALLVKTGVSQAGGEGVLRPEHIRESVADLAALFPNRG